MLVQAFLPQAFGTQNTGGASGTQFQKHVLRRMLPNAIRSSATASERPPHKETHAYGCCVSTLTRFVRPPLQRPLTGSRASNCLSFVCRAGGGSKMLKTPH